MVNLHEIGGSRKYNDWDEKGPRISTHVCWHVITKQHHHGTDGNVDFQLSYAITRSLSSSKNDELLSTDINWGDSKVVNLPDNTSDWIVAYTPFNKGTVQQLALPSSTIPPFITVTRPSLNTIQIVAAPPPEF
jgi:hypothetical protein